MSRVLLLGSVPRVLLAVARSLGRGGMTVIVGLEWSLPLLARSRYIESVRQIDRYQPGDPGWIASVERLIDAEAIDTVIPCGDWETLLCDVHRSALSPKARLAMPGAEALRLSMDKVQSHALADSLGVSVPRQTVIPAQQAEAARLPPGFALPLVLKPCQSFTLDAPGRWQRVAVAHSADEFSRRTQQIGAHSDVIVQEYFSGSSVGVELLVEDGAPKLWFQHERVHQPAGGGPSSYRRSVKVREELYDASIRLLRAMRFTGVAMVEFLVDSQSGRWCFVEVNPRFWGSLPLAIVSGVDFPLGLHQLAWSRPVTAAGEARIGEYCRNLTLDLKWFLESTRTHGSRWKAMGQFLVNLVRMKEHSDAFAVDDPAPALFELQQLLMRPLRR